MCQRPALFYKCRLLQQFNQHDRENNAQTVVIISFIYATIVITTVTTGGVVNTLIVYKSYHRLNTEKVAKAMAGAMNAQLTKVEDVRPEALAGYDLIGFGSGIYGLKHHKALIELIEAMPAMDKSVFVFSTCGNVREVNHKLIKEKLTEKGCHIVGEFTCFGEFAGALRLNRDWKGALAFIGGKNKGHPDEKDLENARAFAKGLLGA